MNIRVSLGNKIKWNPAVKTKRALVQGNNEKHHN